MTNNSVADSTNKVVVYYGMHALRIFFLKIKVYKKSFFYVKIKFYTRDYGHRYSLK